MRSLEIGKKINSILTANQDISNLVGDKIFPLIAESNTTFPFIVFKRNNIIPEYTKDWLSGEKVSVEIVCASNKYTECVDVASKVVDILSGYEDELIRESRVTLISEEYYSDCYIQRINIEVII